MDQHKHSCALPNTPRINDRIMEYYQKFGHDRDLEKFMRIYSPASSQDSQRTQGVPCRQRHRTKSRETISSTSSSCEALAMMPTRPLSGCCGVNSKSMPNIIDEAPLAFKDVIVDINIELEEDHGKVFRASTENIQTPKKCPHAGTKQVQTPESVAKTHRRLEWDSLGDIGYIKSMSTSNISVLERSLLKEFFKESSVTSEPPTSHHKGESVAQPQLRQEPHKQVKIIKSNSTDLATPPLASSTLVDGISGNRGARPKMISKSTSSTSLQNKFEKYAQTSLLKPANMHSQEIQVSMSSSTSVVEGTATPSSFEYYSSRSSKSRSSRSSGCVSSSLSNTNIPPAQHPFITSITDLLKKRKALNEKTIENRKQCDSIRELQSKFQAALEENKENHSHSNTTSSTATSFSLSRQAPELDLGIQLICSLIDAKSVNGKQKKKLIRDIVKRITRLNSDEDQEPCSVTSNHTQTSMSFEKQKVYDDVYSRRRSATSCQEFPGIKTRGANVPPSDLGVTPIQTGVSSNISNTTINSTSEQLENIQVHQTKSKEQGNQTKSTKNQQKVLGNSNQQTVGKSNDKQLPLSATNVNHNKVPNLSPIAAQKCSKGMQSELNAMQKKSSNESDAENHNLLDIRTTRSTQTTKSSGSTESKKLQLSSSTRTTSSGATTSSSSSHDLPTQKSLRKNIIHTNTDGGDQATMREWLNPLTQSEIEYEEKKREESENKCTAAMEAAKREKNAKKSKHDCGRVQQLNWIDNEIHRLECLKHLLLKDDNEKSSVIQSTDESSKNIKESYHSTHTDKLYDTVYSDKSSVLSESAERLVKEIEVILEESSEDIINLKDNSKRTKEREKETQIVYEKPTDNKGWPDECNKAKFRTTKETITINEEHMLSNDGKTQVQRQKIDTPSTDQSQEGQGCTESLRDLVKQRKREFMASYKTKKQNHYDALKQQQKEQGKFKYLPIKEVLVSKDRPPVYPGHYSVPHNINRNFSPTEYAYPQSNLPPTPEEEPIKSPIHIVYSTATAFNHMETKHKQSPSTTAATTTTSSSTSMFCISSDVSVPMGSNNYSSTPTTTHHYDDVAAAVVAGVAVQTSDRIQPYFYPKRSENANFNFILQPTISTTAAIQVKPKGIAYVIEFDNNKSAPENSNMPERNLDLIPSESATTFTTNNIQLLGKASSEPQLTLQEHLEKAKPNFLKHTKERKAILNQLQSMRQARDRQLREIIDNTSFNSLERRLQYLPPPPIQKHRILKTKEMKALTNKRVASLPEVVARKQREQEEKKRRGNRILRDVFNLRLQKRVRNGKLSLNHSKTVI